MDIDIINKVFFKPGTYRQSVFVSPAANRADLPDIALPEEPLGFDLPIRAKA